MHTFAATRSESVLNQPNWKLRWFNSIAGCRAASPQPDVCADSFLAMDKPVAQRLCELRKPKCIQGGRGVSWIETFAQIKETRLSSPRLISFQPTPMSRFVLGYVGAVSTAVSIAVSWLLCVHQMFTNQTFRVHMRQWFPLFACQLGLGVLIKRANRFSPAMKMVIQKFVPFPAVGKSALQLPVTSWFLRLISRLSKRIFSSQLLQVPRMSFWWGTAS